VILLLPSFLVGVGHEVWFEGVHVLSILVIGGCGQQRLVVAHAGGLHALLALLGDEGDSLAFLEGLEAVLL
jgi:hypothetical protein